MLRLVAPVPGACGRSRRRHGRDQVIQALKLLGADAEITEKGYTGDTFHAG